MSGTTVLNPSTSFWGGNAWCQNLEGGTMNMWSGAGTFEAYLLDDDEWADLSGGYQYGITLANQTNSDFEGPATIRIEGAEAREDDRCQPGDWHPLQTPIGCDARLSNNLTPSQQEIEITPETPIRAHSQCTFSAPCPYQFLRLVGVPHGLHAIAVVTRLKRTGGPAIPQWPQHP